MDDNIKNMEGMENKPSGQNPENSVEEVTNEVTENVENISDENIEETTEDIANEDTSEENADEVTENSEISLEEAKNTESEFDTKERKPIKNLGKIVISVVAVAMVATTAYAVLNPVNIIKRATTKTLNQYVNRTSITNTIGLKDIVNMIDTKSVSVDAELNVNDNSYMPSINGGGISFSFDKDVDKKLAQSKISALYKNTALMDLYSYTDNKDIVVYAPALYEKAIKFSCDNILKQYFDSPLMAGSSAEYNKDKDFSVKLFDDNKVTEKADKYFNIYSDFTSQLQYYTNLHWNEATKNATLKKNENKDITVGEKELKCKSYTLTVPYEDVNKFIIGVVRDTSKGSGFDNFLTEYATYMYTSQPMYQYFFENEADLEKYIKDSVQESISNIEKNAKFGDLAINFYINGGMLIKCESSMNVTVDNSVMDINANMALNGSENPIDLINSEVAFNSDGSVLKFSLSDRAENKENSIDVSKELNVDDALGNNIKLVANGRYDTKNNQLLASIDKSNSGRDTQGISLKAKVVPAKDTLNADISEFNVDMMGVTCSGNGLLDVRPLSEDIAAPDSEAMEVFKVDKETVENAMNSAKDKFTEIMSKFKGLK
ncbi:MAG: hypothetical protein ACLU9M_09540 [Lachnospirales bacterium]